MMNQKYKQAWIDALRSGKFEQGTERLCRNGKYCCLGVLCEINKEELGIIKEGIELFTYNGDPDFPTSRLQKEFFGEGEIPEVEIDDELRNLAEHNDRGKTFAQIADAIEAQL